MRNGWLRRTARHLKPGKGCLSAGGPPGDRLKALRYFSGAMGVSKAYSVSPRDSSSQFLNPCAFYWKFNHTFQIYLSSTHQNIVL